MKSFVEMPHVCALLSYLVGSAPLRNLTSI